MTGASEFHSEPDAKKHVLAHVFKVVVDPFVGKLGIFRVHQGTVTKDTQLFIGDGSKPFKVGHLFMLQGGKNVEIDRAVPGDIVAVAKVDEIDFDAVLHDSHDEDQIHMRPLEFPVPMHGVAITPKKRGDEQRISDVLHRMLAEDPTLVIEHDAIDQRDGPARAGRAAPALDPRADGGAVQARDRRRARRAFRIARRSPRRPRASTGTRSRPAARASSARSRCASSRCARGAGFEFVDSTKGGVIPHQFMPAVQKGVEQVLATGAIAGFPMQDVRVVVYDGKHHPVDSKEVAFVSAGRKAFLDAIEKARPIVLEPIVSVEVICPEANTGDIAGDLSSRRGQVTGTTGLQPGHHRDQRSRAARRARRLFGAAEVRDRRPRVVVDGAVALRAGAAEPAAAAQGRVQEVAPRRRRIEAISKTTARPDRFVAPAAASRLNVRCAHVSLH